MKAKLIIVRHGQTAWNRQARFRGRMDLPLDKVGMAQARAAAAKIYTRWPDVTTVYCSPLLRARQTAEPIAERFNLEVQVHAGLLDINYGEWTGLTAIDAKRRDLERHTLWRTAPQQVHFPQGESLSDVQSRLQSLLAELLQLHSAQRVVLVGHLVVNRVLICTLLDVGLQTYWRIGQDVCAINEAHYQDGMGQLLSLNDTCHLAEGFFQGGSDV